MIIFDVETTGVDVQKDRIVELGFEMWTAEGMVKSWRSYINPLVPMPAGAQSVHGITDEFIKKACRHCQDEHISGARFGKYDHEWASLPTFKQLAPSLAKGFSDCDFAGQNVRFDLQILFYEMKRVGQPWSYSGARIVDANRLEALLHPRDLSSLHAKYVGLPHDGAHGALSDVRAAATVIAHQLQRDGLPKDLDQLHEAQWPGFLTADGSFKLIDGAAVCNFGKHRGKLVRDVPADYWDWLLGADFPEDVRQVARDAKMGKYDA